MTVTYVVWNPLDGTIFQLDEHTQIIEVPEGTEELEELLEAANGHPFP